MSKQNTVAVVRGAIEPAIVALGYTLWDIEYVKEGAEWFLRIFPDAESGIGLAECEAVYHAINPIIDELDPIEYAYTLEVCSPGIERTLRTDEHLQYAVGKCVKLALYKPHEGKKEYIGTLTAANEDGITLDVEGVAVTFERSAVSRVKMHHEF